MQNTNPQKCEYCGSISPHLGVCPRIASIEYFEDGTVKQVYFFQVKNEPVRMIEDDAKFRERLRVHVPSHSVWYKKIDTATPRQLDEIGLYYDVRRGEYATETG